MTVFVSLFFCFYFYVRHRTYLELISELPWETPKPGAIDVSKARQILDAVSWLGWFHDRSVDHWGVIFWVNKCSITCSSDVAYHAWYAWCQDHFGLEKVKKRLLEYLAVCSLKVRDELNHFATAMCLCICTANLYTQSCWYHHTQTCSYTQPCSPLTLIV